MEVSHYAKRIIDMRDGRILRDHLVEHRRSAAADLQTLEAVEVER
jgi:putative ABC transport system ATP-binding protein